MQLRPPKESVDKLIATLVDKLDFGIDQNGRACAVMRSGDTTPQLYCLTDNSIKELIVSEAKSNDMMLMSKQIEEVRTELHSFAESSGQLIKTSIRVSRTVNGGVEIDLGTGGRECIRLHDGVVSVLGRGSESVFYRPPATKPLVMPSEEGNISLLLNYLNMSDMDNWLLIAWLSYTLSTAKDDDCPYPILVLIAGQGSAKTTTCKLIIRSLVDPSAMGVQGFPKNRQDMVLASNNCHVLIYDNLRRLSEAWSDTLCIASTGGNDPTRKLYTDSGMVNHTLKVPLVLNGIHDFVTEPDLAQRCIRLELNNIPEGQRRDEQTFTDEFLQDLPDIFRGLLDLTAQVLNCLDDAEVTHPQRMHRFVKYLAAIEHVYGWPPSTLQQHYADIVKRTQGDAVLEDPLASTIHELVTASSKGELNFTPSQLLNELRQSLPQGDPRVRLLPTSPIALSKRLQALTMALGSQGIDIQFTRGKERRITITDTEKF